MKREFKLIIIASFIFTISCKQNQPKDSENIITPTNLTPDKTKPEANSDQTEMNDESYNDEMAEKIIKKIDEINISASQSNKVETKILLSEIENTPVTVWYNNDKTPIKAEFGVTDDGGEFTGKFTLYFNNGKLWCSDWNLAKFIFDENGKLKYWLDDSWKISETEETAGPYFKQKEEINFNILNEILAKVKFE